MTFFGKLTVPLAWTGLVIAGFGSLLSYEATPGSSDKLAIVAWPSSSALNKANGEPTIVVFAHPDCPCTRASLDGLADLMARKNKYSARLIVDIVEPRGLKVDLQKSSIAQSARRIKGAEIVVDPDGAEARRFGAETSGHTVVFSGKGQFLFSGGLTTFRGHYGPSAGLDAVSDILDTGQSTILSAPVYGCSLLGSAGKGVER